MECERQRSTAYPSYHISTHSLCLSKLRTPIYVSRHNVDGYAWRRLRRGGTWTYKSRHKVRHPCHSFTVILLSVLLVLPREGDTQGNGRQERSMPLGVPLTGNMLFTISWILGLGIPKAIYSNRGQSLISPTLDLVGGIIFTLM